MSEEELPRGWAKAPLGDLCRTVEKSDPRKWGEGTSFAYFDISSIDNDRHRVQEPREVASSSAPSRARQIVRPGDVLFSTVRTYLQNIAMVPSSIGSGLLVASTGFCVLRALDGIDPRFLFYRCLTADLLAEMSSQQQGTSYPAIRDEDLLRFEIGLPPSEEQVRIADELERRLSHVDAALSYLRSSARRLKGARAATLKTAASGALVGERAHATWHETLLGQVATTIKNGIFVSRPGLERVGPAILRISAVRPLRLDTSDVRYAHVSDDQAKPYFLEADDLLFVRYNGNAELVGACARVTTLDQPTIYPDKLIRVVVDRNKVLPAFIEIAVAQGASRDAIRSASKTTAGQTGIAGGELRRVPLRLPDLELQHEIVEEVHRRLSLIDATERSVQFGIRKCEWLRRSLLTAAFNGRLVPQDASEEPATVLLERINASRSAEDGSVRRRKTARKEKVS